MGNNLRDAEPEKATSPDEHVAPEAPDEGRQARDGELVAAWLEKEFGAAQPAEAVEALLEADAIAATASSGARPGACTRSSRRSIR